MQGLKDAGMSLVSVMMAAALAGIVLLATISSNELGMKSARSVQLAQETNLVMDRIRIALATPSICSANFKDVGVHLSLGSDIQQLKVGTSILAEAGSFMPPGLRVTSIRLEELNPLVPKLSFLASLRVGFEKQGGIIGQKNVIRETPLYLSGTVAGTTLTIAECASTGITSLGDAAAICALLGGEWDLAHSPPCRGLVGEGGAVGSLVAQCSIIPMPGGVSSTSSCWGGAAVVGPLLHGGGVNCVCPPGSSLVKVVGPGDGAPEGTCQCIKK